jgi:hypothetical protein
MGLDWGGSAAIPCYDQGYIPFCYDESMISCFRLVDPFLKHHLPAYVSEGRVPSLFFSQSLAWSSSTSDEP